MIEQQTAIQKTPNHLIVTPPEGPKLISARNLDGIPLPLDLFKPTRPYANFAIREMKPFTLREEDKTTTPTPSPVISLLVVKLDDGDPMKQLHRGELRASQFDRIFELLIHSETSLQEGRQVNFYLDYPSDEDESKTLYTKLSFTAKYLERLKHLLLSFYTFELKGESYTELLAKSTIEKHMLVEEAVVRQAEQIVFNHQRPKFNSFEVRQEEIHNKPNKQSDNEVNDTKQADSRKVAEAEIEKQEKKVAVEKGKTGKGEDKERFLYIHDPKLDEPSEDAAIYFNELWEIQF